MADSKLIPVTMPKWGLSMKEGKVTGWLVEDGAAVKPGDAILEIETDKIAGSVEAAEPGVLRRVGATDTMYPVKTLLGVIADPSVPQSEIDAFVGSYIVPVGEDGEDDGPKFEFAEVDGLKLRYSKTGDSGDAVIMIHGFGGDLGSWMFNVDALAEGATVYALDLPGHGQSTKRIDDPSIAGLAKVVSGFMDAVGVTAAHFVGHSLGGAISAQLAATAPDRVKSITLIGSAALGPDINIDYISGFVSAPSRRELKPVLELLFADAGQVNRAMVDDILKFKRLDGATEALTTLAGGVFPDGRQAKVLADAVKAGKTRSLLLHGADDKIIPSSHTAALGGTVMAGGSHMLHMEQANAVNAAIKKHIGG